MKMTCLTQRWKWFFKSFIVRRKIWFSFVHLVFCYINLIIIYWAPHLWNERNLMSSRMTTPELMSSSAKASGSMPSSWCLLNWRPEFCSKSMLSCAYMSSLPKYNIRQIELQQIRKHPDTNFKKAYSQYLHPYLQ